jgi:hypothetical protein
MWLSITEVNSALFTHNPKAKTLTAEHSDLGSPAFVRMYDDACDVGLALRNKLTGNVTRWVLANEERDGEGELTGWVLHPAPESLRANAALLGYKIVIFND